LQEVKQELEAEAPQGTAPDPFAERQRDQSARQDGRRDGSPPENRTAPQAEPLA
jgi:hypothetical protein